jgi:FtsH-binding integral membrane protein
MNNHSYNNYNQGYEVNVREVDERYVANYVAKVFGWMFLGLSVTAILAFLIASSTTIPQLIASNRMLFFGLVLGQLALVGFLVFRIQKMSTLVATAIFFGYAALNGLTFSLIVLAFPPSTLLMVFGITAGTFGIMSLVGYFTKQDLTSFGRLMMMGLIGVIIASVVNMFMGSEFLYWIISYVGVAVFVGLIAYDTQKIKSYAYLEDEESRKKGAIMGALALYLDFINLFIMLLRLFGNRN